MADSAFKTQISRDENANSASNVVFIQVADDAGNVASITGGALDVNATVTLETAYVDDSAFTVGTDKVNAQGFLFDDVSTDTVDEGDIGLARMTSNRIVLQALEDPASGNRLVIDASGFPTVNVNGTVTVQATNLDIRDLTHVSDSVSIGDGTTLADVLDGTIDALYVAITDGADSLAINADGSINTSRSNAAQGTAVHDYKTATPGAGASDNHDYTVAGTTFYLTGVSWGGSGKEKCEILVGPLASLATKYVGFSEKDDQGHVKFDPAIPVPATGTGTVRAIITNRQGAAVDVYSTIMGDDV